MLKRLATVLTCLIATACLAAGAAAAHGVSHSAHSGRRGLSAARRSHRGCARHSAKRGRQARRHGRSRCSAPVKGTTIGARTAPVSRHRKTQPPLARAATFNPAVPAHTETWAYDDCGNGGAGASATMVRAWVTYAEANCGPNGAAKALGDCHANGTVFCNVIQYLDTNWIYANGSPPWQSFSGAASESWYQHLPGSSTTRIASSSYGGGYLVNQQDAGARSFFQSYVRNNYAATDGLMMDDQSAGLSSQLYYSTCGCQASQEVASTPALQTAHGDMSAAMTRSTGQPFVQIDNALPPNPWLPQGLGLLNHSTGVKGLISEGAPEDNGTLDPYYSTLLDQIAYVANNTSSFVVPLSYGAAGASYQAQSRRVQEATILLGYRTGHLVDWAALEQGSNHLAVWPEESIYPANPVQSMGAPGGSGCLAGTGNVCSSGGHADLQVAPGVYRREFRSCYRNRLSFGACATIVNTTASPVTVRSAWLTHSYGHQIAWQGGDVQSGGTLNLAGSPFTAGNTTVGAHDATLLAR